MLSTIAAIVEDRRFQNAITGVILLNAVILGLQTIPSLDPSTVMALHTIDTICLVVFCVELTFKFIVKPGEFFRKGENIFDFVVVAIALVPSSGGLAVLRALRVLRLLRLVTMLPSMRRVVSGMFMALPGAGSVAGVLMVMFYVAAVMATNFFQHSVPERFGDLLITFLTLFKIMSLEGWPDIADEVMQHHPYAWAFFIPFIILTTFTTLNLLFGIIVSAMEEAKEEEARERMAAQGVEMTEETSEMRLAMIEAKVKEMHAMLEEIRAASVPAAPAKTAREPAEV